MIGYNYYVIIFKKDKSLKVCRNDIKNPEYCMEYYTREGWKHLPPYWIIDNNDFELFKIPYEAVEEHMLIEELKK